MDVNVTSFVFIRNSSLQHVENGIFGKGKEVILHNQQISLKILQLNQSKDGIKSVVFFD